MNETELKFGIVAASVPAVERAMVRHGARSVGIESRYWDTPDFRLARADLSLRLRKSRGRWEQTVKAAGPSPAERLEETVRGPAVNAGAEPRPDLSLHAGTRAGRLLARALDGSDNAAALELVHTTRVRRRFLLVAWQGSEIEVALDRGQVEAGGRSLPVCEVEAELKQGDAKAALEPMRKAVELNDEPDATLFDHLGDIYAALNQREKAREAWRKSLQIEPSKTIEQKLKEPDPPPGSRSSK